MRKLLILSISLTFSLFAQAQVSKTINITAGTLSSALTALEQTTITDLTITGTIDARDFKTMRDSMDVLANIDLRGVGIEAYSGAGGTYYSNEAGNVYFEYSANQIPHYAFYNLENEVGKNSLVSVFVPLTVTNFADGCFYLCTGLTSLNIPIGVDRIDGFAFTGCTGLSNIVIPSSVTYVLGNAFQNCTGLSSLIIEEGVDHIGDYAFEGCSSLSSITITDSVTFISDHAFQNCTGLDSLILGESIETIGSYAFDGCSELTYVKCLSTLPVDLSSSLNVFQNVNKTTCTLYVPFGSKAAYELVDQWQDFHNIVETPVLTLSTNDVLIGYLAYSTDSILVVSDSTWTASSDQTWLTVNPTSNTGIDTLIIEAEANPDLYRRSAIVTVCIADVDTQYIYVTQKENSIEVVAGELSSLLTTEEKNTITDLTLTGTIDARDFRVMRDEMPNLESLDLSGAGIVSYVGTEGSCIESYDIIYGVNAVPSHAFYNNLTNEAKTGLTTVILPSTLTTFESNCFESCTGLTSVNIPTGVTEVWNTAFKSCSGLSSITIPSGVSAIEREVFMNCTGLSTLILEEGVTIIGSQSFAGCIGLSEITIPEGVTFIDDYAFDGCAGSVLIIIPSSVITIGNRAFWKCSGLISVDEANPNYSSEAGVLFNKNKTT